LFYVVDRTCMADTATREKERERKNERRNGDS